MFPGFILALAFCCFGVIVYYLNKEHGPKSGD